MLRRWGHGAAVLDVSTECVEVILFGGRNLIGGSMIADSTTVLGFGMSLHWHNCSYHFMPVHVV